MPVDPDIDARVSRFRNLIDQELGTATPVPQRPTFRNPCAGDSVPAAEFLLHLDLDVPGINAVLQRAYSYLEVVANLKADTHARVKFLVWMTLRHYNQILPAYRSLRADVGAQHLLGFTRGMPCYDTLREFVNEKVVGAVFDDLVLALLREQKRLLPALGEHQVEDATPQEARRRETEAPYNPHYKVRMQKLEFRFDVGHQSLLTHQFYHGTASEGRWAPILTRRLEEAGVHASRITVDNSYVSFLQIALNWRQGHPLRFRQQDAWKPDETIACQDVLKRYQKHWKHPHFIREAPLEAQLRFLVDHGTGPDIEAAGRYLRDHDLSTRTQEDTDLITSHRSQNEGLNAEIKRLPLSPARRASKEMLRRTNACVLTLHCVQLTRLQHGVTYHLCRTANIL